MVTQTTAQSPLGFGFLGNLHSTFLCKARLCLHRGFTKGRLAHQFNDECVLELLVCRLFREIEHNVVRRGARQACRRLVGEGAAWGLLHFDVLDGFEGFAADNDFGRVPGNPPGV